MAQKTQLLLIKPDIGSGYVEFIGQAFFDESDMGFFDKSVPGKFSVNIEKHRVTIHDVSDSVSGSIGQSMSFDQYEVVFPSVALGQMRAACISEGFSLLSKHNLSGCIQSAAGNDSNARVFFGFMKNDGYFSDHDFESRYAWVESDESLFDGNPVLTAISKEDADVIFGPISREDGFLSIPVWSNRDSTQLLSIPIFSEEFASSFDRFELEIIDIWKERFGKVHDFAEPLLNKDGFILDVEFIAKKTGFSNYPGFCKSYINRMLSDPYFMAKLVCHQKSGVLGEFSRSLGVDEMINLKQNKISIDAFYKLK